MQLKEKVRINTDWGAEDVRKAEECGALRLRRSWAFLQPTRLQRNETHTTAHFVYFATGSHALTPDDRKQIRDVAGMMQSTPSFNVTIIGKADTTGSKEFNEHLSQRRAEAVFEELVYNGKVSENRVQICWTGERLPFASTADQVAESQNRMVAIVVTDDVSAHCGAGMK